MTGTPLRAFTLGAGSLSLGSTVGICARRGHTYLRHPTRPRDAITTSEWTLVRTPPGAKGDVITLAGQDRRDAGARNAARGKVSRCAGGLPVCGVPFRSGLPRRRRVPARLSRTGGIPLSPGSARRGLWLPALYGAGPLCGPARRCRTALPVLGSYRDRPMPTGHREPWR